MDIWTGEKIHSGRGGETGGSLGELLECTADFWGLVWVRLHWPTYFKRARVG